MGKRNCGANTEPSESGGKKTAWFAGMFGLASKGGNGLLPPVTAKPAQGFSNEIGLLEVAFKVYSGAKGATPVKSP
jgi:hypothetical protein